MGCVKSERGKEITAVTTIGARAFLLTSLVVFASGSSTAGEPNNVEGERWSVSVGAMGFYFLAPYDAVSEGISGGEDVDTSGSQVGYRLSVGKARNTVGIAVYNGGYTIEDSQVYSDAGSKRSEINIDRIDGDLGWAHALSEDENGGWGFVLGVKYVGADKTITVRETNGGHTDFRKFTGDATWWLGTIGVFGSLRLSRNLPLSLFGSFNTSLGAVDGMVALQKDDMNDAVIENVYGEDSSAAYGLNGTLGLRYLVFSHFSLEIGYRGQILNSTDGFMTTANFYDGQHALFLAGDILF